MSTDLSKLLPLTETMFFILLSMVHQPRHGYAILKDVEELSNGRIKLSAGTLYGALGRMLDQGWIVRVEGAEPDESGRPRKEYELTDLGKRLLAAETRRLETLVGLARLRSVGQHS